MRLVKLSGVRTARVFYFNPDHAIAISQREDVDGVPVVLIETTDGDRHARGTVEEIKDLFEGKNAPVSHWSFGAGLTPTVKVVGE